jgi:hypothetical protein
MFSGEILSYVVSIILGSYYGLCVGLGRVAVPGFCPVGMLEVEHS